MTFVVYYSLSSLTEESFPKHRQRAVDRKPPARGERRSSRCHRQRISGDGLFAYTNPLMNFVEINARVFCENKQIGWL